VAEPSLRDAAEAATASVWEAAHRERVSEADLEAIRLASKALRDVCEAAAERAQQ
jgi:hypothetical protein